MHELSIAQSILDTVRQHVAEEDLGSVRAVALRIGDLAGVMAESLEFSYQSLTADTSLAGSSLRIERIPFRIECQDCHQTSSNERGFALCRVCGSGNTRVLSGNELHVVEIELNDTEEGPA